MSRTAAVSVTESLTAQAGPAALTTRIRPVTSAQVRSRAEPLIGLVPTSPTIGDGATSVIPDLLRIVKAPEEPRLTGVR
jgi:hypothetical protein